MTGYTVHTGSTKQFASGWERIFGSGGKPRMKPAAKKSKAARARKKPK